MLSIIRKSKNNFLNMPEKIIWNIIDSYFKTIKNNLVNHHIDSYNMFVMEQIPKVIRQFNPITSYYDNNEVRLDIIIGGSIVVGFLLHKFLSFPS